MEPSFHIFRRTASVAARVSRGFTLVEMLVVLAIIALISAVVVNGQSSYNNSLLLNDTAYTIAYSVRQAQSLGLASRGSNSVTSAGYGVRFGGTTGYTVFADIGGTKVLSATVCPTGTLGTPDVKPGNCKYDVGTDTIVQSYTFSRGFTIQSICGKLTGSSSCTPIASLDVVFMRPETRAILIGPQNQSYSCAQVTVLAPTGTASRVIRVSQLGEISVGQNCP